MDFIGIYFLGKIEILGFGGQNRKKSIIWDNHLVARLFLRLLAFTDCVFLQTCSSNVCHFLPKIAEHDSTKMPISQTFIDGFFWNLDCRRQIHPGESIRNLVSISVAVFQPSRRSGWRGRIHPPPPAPQRRWLTLALWRRHSQIPRWLLSMRRWAPHSFCFWRHPWSTEICRYCATLCSLP